MLFVPTADLLLFEEMDKKSDYKWFYRYTDAFERKTFAVLRLHKEKSLTNKNRQGNVNFWYQLIDEQGKIGWMCLVSQTIEELESRGKIKRVY